MIPIDTSILTCKLVFVFFSLYNTADLEAGDPQPGNIFLLLYYCCCVLLSGHFSLFLGSNWVAWELKGEAQASTMYAYIIVMSSWKPPKEDLNPENIIVSHEQGNQNKPVKQFA